MSGRPPSIRSAGAILVHASILRLAAVDRTTPGEVRAALARGDGRTHARFRAALADQLHHALHPGHPELRGLHLFGSATGPDCRKTSDLDLLVHLSDGRSPLVAALKRLDRQISREFADVAGIPADGFRMLDLHVVTDEDVRGRMGFAAVLGSVHVRAQRIA